MNRAFLIIVFFSIWGCDTTNNVKPLGDEYFIKFYGAIGKQEGVSVKATPDGGFIIGGNSISVFEGQSDYLLIKVDAFGNQEWTETYDFNGNGTDDHLTELILETNGYIIAGTSEINNLDKMVLLRVDLTGQKLRSFIIEEFVNDSFTCTGVTLSELGNIIVVGNLENNLFGNSILTVVNTSLAEPTKSYYTGITAADKDIVQVIGFELVDDTTQEITYLAFGQKESSGINKLGFIYYDRFLEPIDIFSFSDFFNSKTVEAIPISNGNFMVLGGADDRSVLVKISKATNGYSLPQSGQDFGLQPILQGVSLSSSNSDHYSISSNLLIENSDITSSSLSSVRGINGNIEWERIHGTNFTYSSGKVITLNDGSIVYTGTAGLKDQNKVFLIKMKSNGEMK